MNNIRNMIVNYPQLYIGHNWDMNGLHYLLSEIIGLATQSKSMNNSTYVVVSININKSVSIEDNGRGLPIEPTKVDNSIELPAILHVMTWFMCRHPNSPYYKKYGYMNHMGTVLSYISERLDVETVYQGKQYHFALSRGEIIIPLREVTLTREKGTKLVFSPNLHIFQAVEFDLSLFIKYMSSIAQEFSHATLKLYDHRIGWSKIF